MSGHVRDDEVIDGSEMAHDALIVALPILMLDVVTVLGTLVLWVLLRG